MSSPRPVRRVLSQAIALLFCTGAITRADAVVINLGGNVSDGWVATQLYDSRGHPAGMSYTWRNSSLVLYPKDVFGLLSLSDAWTLSFSLNVAYTQVDRLSIAGGELISDRSSLGTVSITGGGRLYGDNLAAVSLVSVQGIVEAQSSGFSTLSVTGGSFTTGGGYASTSLALNGTVFSARSFSTASADIASSTLSAMDLWATDRLALDRSTLGEPATREGSINTKALILTDSTVRTGQATVGESLQMQRSSLEARSVQLGEGVSRVVLEQSTLRADEGYSGARYFSLDLRGSTFSVAQSYVYLHAGAAGTDALGMDEGSSLVTASTRLWGEYADTTLRTTFVQSGGSHVTRELQVPTRTAYVLGKAGQVASGPGLDAAYISVGGEFRMYGGTLKAGDLSLEEAASFTQTAGASTIGLWTLMGTARIGGTATVTASNTDLDGGLAIEQSAQVNAGWLRVNEGGSVLLERPGDSIEQPALRTSAADIAGGFHHADGHHVTGRMNVASGTSDQLSGRYWLAGGVLQAETLSIRGHFEQSGGESKLGAVDLSAAYEPVEPNLSISGGRLDAARLAIADWGLAVAPLIRQTGGVASFGSLSLEGARYELAIAVATGGKADLTVRDWLQVRGRGELPGSFQHSAGRMVVLGYMDITQGGVYELSGTGLLDASASEQPFEVLQRGRFHQSGGEIKARGFDVDKTGSASIEAGRASFREWMAVNGEMAISGSAVVDIGGDEFGLQVGAPYIEGDNEGVTPGEGQARLTLALGPKGSLTSSQVGIGTYESGTFRHDSGLHVVTGKLTLGSTRVLTDASYWLDTMAELHAAAIELSNPLAADETDRARVRFEQTLGKGNLRFASFSSLNGTHHVHASASGDADWVIGDFVARDGERRAASYDARGSTLYAETGLKLVEHSTMSIAPSAQMRGAAEVRGSMALADWAALKLVDKIGHATPGAAPTLLVRGGLSIESVPASGVPAMEVFNASVRVLGQGLPADRPTVTVGPAGSYGASHLLLNGPSARMEISGPQTTQLRIGAGGGGDVSLRNGAVLEVRAAPEGSARPAIAGDWRPVVIGQSGSVTLPTLNVDSTSKLVVEGRGNQITVESGIATLSGSFNAIVVGKPTSPGLAAPLSSNGTLTLQKSSVIEVSFDGYAPKAGDYIPIASAQKIAYGSGKLQLTPYQTVKVGDTIGYEFSLGAGNAVFRVATPAAGLYPALERVTVGGTEVLGIRFVDQAVLLNFVDPMEGSYVDSWMGWKYSASTPNTGAATSLDQAALIDAYGSYLWGTAPTTAGAGGASLGSQVMLPYFVADDAQDDRSMANVVDVRFSDDNGPGKLVGHAPSELNTSGLSLIDVGNQQKAGRVHLFKAAALSPVLLASNTLHEVGHSLGLFHTFASGTKNLMDYVDTSGEVFDDEPLMWTESPESGGLPLLRTQNAMLHLLKYSFGWSDEELRAFGADYGSADSDWSKALTGLLVNVRTRILPLGEQITFSQLAVLTPSLTAEGEALWEPLLELDSVSAADIEHMLFTGLRGMPFLIVGTLDGHDGEEIRFIGADGGTGTFGEGVAAGRLVLVDLRTGTQTDLGSYMLDQTAAAVPEPSAVAGMAMGLLLMARRVRRRAQ